MTPGRSPAHLKLVGSTALAVRPHRRPVSADGDGRTGCGRRERLDDAGVLPRETLLSRLAIVADLSGDAPLSFVAVKVYGLKDLHEASGWDACETTLRTVASTLGAMVRATDSVGRLNASTFGVVLQGAGSTAAGSVARRLAHRLNRMEEIAPAVEIRVGAATGTGRNAGAMPVAALAAFEDSAG